MKKLVVMACLLFAGMPALAGTTAAAGKQLFFAYSLAYWLPAPVK